jgi:hypothetical protein
LEAASNLAEAVWAEANYCKPGTDWYNSMKAGDQRRIILDVAET